MYSKKSLFFTVLLLLVTVAVIFIGSTVWRNNKINGINTLSSVEIREYEGQKLSSIDDFRENSIRGPQFIDNESYRLAVTGLVNNEIEFIYDDVISNHPLFEKVVTLHCVEGWDVTILWEGLLVKDLIKQK